MTPRRLVAVFAHPDDETLLAGGTLAACAAEGIETVVVCATRGEVGGGGAPADAGRRREAELRAACRALAVGDVRILGFPDGCLAGAETELAGALASAFAELGPDVIVTFGPEGLYWHPDHVAVHEAVTAALAAASSRASLVFATLPAGAMENLVSEAAALGLPTGLWGIDAAAFGAPADSITTAVDVRPHLDAKLRALVAHASQFPPGHLLHRLPRRLAEKHLGREYFVHGAGAGWPADALGAETARSHLAPCS